MDMQMGKHRANFHNNKFIHVQHPLCGVFTTSKIPIITLSFHKKQQARNETCVWFVNQESYPVKWIFNHYAKILFTPQQNSRYDLCNTYITINFVATAASLMEANGWT